MGRGSLNLAWGRAFTDELARAGVRRACVAPGSRSTPLVLALARERRIRTSVHLDERCAGFFALGAGKATGRPAAVVTTSGTAAANLLPAVVEAGRSGTPLLLLTADRPPRLRGTDANQTVDQVRLYGGHARLFHDVSPPEATAEAFAYLRALAGRAVAAARGRPGGPVHLNFPFDKPLQPEAPAAGGDADAGTRHEAGGDADARGRDGGAAPDVRAGTRGLDGLPDRAARGRPTGAPWVRAEATSRTASEETLARISGLVSGASRGIVVCGPSPAPGRTGPAALALARSAGWPLLADPLSGARFRDGAGTWALGAYDLVLRAPSAEEALAPDLVLRFGGRPTSARLLDFLEAHAGTDHVAVADLPQWGDHRALATEMVRADPADTCSALAARLSGTGSGGVPAWTETWRRAERAAREAVREAVGGGGLRAGEGRDGSAARDAVERRGGGGHDAGGRPGASGRDADAPDRGAGGAVVGFEGAVLATVADALPGGGLLFAGSSMPVRDLDAFAGPRDRDILVTGNRGASGIDGSVSTALGAAAATGRPAVAVLGDLALHHDSNGLRDAGRHGPDIVFVVINNDGGGIFHFLPIREHEPDFERFFGTPHGLDFRPAAEMYGLEHRRVEAGGARAVRDALEAGLDEALHAGGPWLLEVPSDREKNRRRRRAVVESAARAAEEVLAAGS